MNLSGLANAICHWLEYERLCGRSNLLSEAALKAPVGEFLLSTQEHNVQAEEPYPKKMQSRKGRRRSVDFCLKRPRGAKVWTNIIESKWVNGKRNLSQEIFDDLLRLEVVRRKQEPFSRLFLLAGETTNIKKDIFERKVNGSSGGRVYLFQGVLPQNGSLKVPVSAAAKGVVEYWREAAKAIGQNELPLNMNVKLVAKSTAGTYECWVWRISSVRNRKTRNL